ncbi:MAG: DUF2726 domain-containing protein [Planctomycetes bacterium]|nr:DUF2726 domain-containing protein [Planctomycetota bacterium]
MEGGRKKALQQGTRRSWRPYRRHRRFAARRRRKSLPYEGRGTLLTKGEAAFFGPLQEAVGAEFQIMCKVRVADVLTCSDADWHRGFGGAISQKHLDFVLCEPRTTRIILAVELDDRSHEAPHRQRRDRFLNETLQAAGIRLLRIKARAQYSTDIIRRLVFASLHRESPRLPTTPLASHHLPLAP